MAEDRRGDDERAITRVNVPRARGFSVSGVQETEADAAAEKSEESLPAGFDSSLLPPENSYEDARYDERELLGEGGMGRIHLSHDKRVGRDVAMKVLRRRYSKHADTLARFMREARIQGQLEHPSIVPVYDLMRRADGTVCFTMKRVHGKTIEQIVEGLNAKDKFFIENYPRRKLLRAFAAACLAIDFAHSRGVLHRDLKPSNIMLGDFGEVYVLDWGLSKVAGQPDLAAAHAVALPEEDSGTATIDGAVLGTPGYMAPEQARGETAQMDTRADIYALGAILYETLALQPLHGRGSVSGVMNSTVAGADARPSFRAPQRSVPAELDAICVKATQLDAAHRFQSARELHDAIERYLDGEQDMKVTREMAQAHARAAEIAAEYALGDGPRAHEERVRALHEVGRALAMDPSHAEAQRVLLNLLQHPPRVLPPEERAEVDLEETQSGRITANVAAWYHLTFLITTGLVLWMGVKSWTALAVYACMSAATAMVAFFTSRGSLPQSARLYANVIMGTIAIGCMSTMFGPLFLIPGLAAMSTMAAAFNSPGAGARAIVISIGTLAVMVPVVLEGIGILPPSYEFRGDTLVILSRMHHFPPAATLAFLAYIAVGHIVSISVLMGRLHQARLHALEKLHKQTWQLKQLVRE